MDAWAKQVTVSPKTRDEYRSALEAFDRATQQPLERVTGAHVQVWIDSELGDPEEGLDAHTINKKLSGMRNYWRWMAKRGFVSEERKPFHDRDVKNPHGRVRLVMRRYEPRDVVRLWQTAAARGNLPLAHLIQIGAFTGARREGVMRLNVADIKTDPDTGIRFMHTSGKTEAGNRGVPIHSAIAGLIDRLAAHADRDGYLIPSIADNQYGIRGTVLGKEFSALKEELGFGEAHDYHSIRRTVAHLFEAHECPENVAKDIVGHKKLDITYGLYSGRTRLDHRARWLEKSIVYPS